MTLRIEIQEQPERNRYFAEVEVGGMVARRNLVMSPRTGDVLADLDAHMVAIRAALRDMIPGLPPPKGPEKHQEAIAAVGSPTEKPALASLPPEGEAPPKAHSDASDEHPDPQARAVAEPWDAAIEALRVEGKAAGERVDALLAEARAAGVRVDKRWGEARLRQEIAAAGHERAPTSD